MPELAGAVALPRSELLSQLAALRTLCQEYRRLHEHVWEDDAPGDETQALLRRHRGWAHDESGPFAVLGLADALLDYVAARLSGERLVYRLPGHGPGLPAAQDEGISALARQLGALQAPLEVLASRVFALAQAAPQPGELRVQRVLYPVAALFKAILRQDWADAELVLNHLNMVTTSRDNHALVEQIGRIVRGIYDSLNEISRSVPIEALSDASEEIPDAVEKLGQVISELEDGANRNLDLLEALTEQVHESRELLGSARQALADCDAELAALAEQEPEAAPALRELQALLQEQATGRLAGLAGNLDTAHDVYMTLFANQSYQDLTGQTLKKVIAFIESLQYQLIQVISKGSGKATVGASVGSHDSPHEAGPDAHDRLSQDKVDAMLAELGF